MLCCAVCYRLTVDVVASRLVWWLGGRVWGLRDERAPYRLGPKRRDVDKV